MDMRTIEKLTGDNLEKNWSAQMTDFYKNMEIAKQAEAEKDRKTQEQKFQEKVLEMFEELEHYTESYSLGGFIKELREIMGVE